jgi:hypothetical protein
MPPKLPCPTCAPTLPANCWQCVGSTGSGWYERRGATASGGGGSRVVLCCCLALWAGCRVGAAWHGNGCGTLSALAWGGPGLCMGVGSCHNLPSMSGAVGAVGPCAMSQDQQQRLSWFGVSCVVCHGTWGWSQWLGVLCGMAAQVGQCKHGRGVDELGRAVHHGTAQSAHLTDTQTSPFADRLTAVCRCALFLLKLPCCSALLHWLCRPSTEDWPTYRSPPLHHCYYLNSLILPTFLPIRL